VVFAGSVSTAGNHTLWPFKKRALTSDQEVRLVEVLANAFGQALQRTLDAQSNQINQQSGFLATLQDMSAKKAAQVMGQRGGRRTQERKRARAQLLAPPHPECGLCIDPNRRDVSVEMVRAHNQHVAVRRAEPAEDTHANGNGV